MRRRAITFPTGKRKRLRTLVAALLLAALLAIPSSGAVLAQEPPEGASLILVNAGEEFVDRKKDGRFIARPLFNRPVGILYYGVRDGDTGEWLTPMYHVRDGGKDRRDGREYSFEYPFEKGQAELDPERPYLLVIIAGDSPSATPRSFHAAIPPHQPGGLWNKILNALDPERWGKAIARWVIEGAHGTLCGVVERAAGASANACEASP